MIIRDADELDGDQLRSLFMIGQCDAPESYDKVEFGDLMAAVGHGNVLVAEEDGELAGMITRTPTKYGTVLSMLVVRRKWRGCTLSVEMIRAATGSEKTFSIIEPHALAAFERAGYRKKGYLVIA